MRHLAAAFLLPLVLSLGSCATTPPPIVNDIVTCGGNAVAPTDVTEVYNDLTTQNWVDLATVGVRLGWDVIACVIDDVTAKHPELKPAGEKFKADHAAQIKQAQRPSVSMGYPRLDRGGAAQNTGDARNERVLRAADPAEGAHVDAIATGEAPDSASAVPWGAWSDLGDSSASPGKSTPLALAVELVTPGGAGPGSGRGGGGEPSLADCDTHCGAPNSSLVAKPGGCLCWVGSGRSGHWQAAR